MQLIDHIDAIARKKQRTVLFLTFDTVKITSRTKREYRKAFNKYQHFGNCFTFPGEMEIYENFDDNPHRQTIIDWLSANDIGWEMCGDFASENGWRSYHGQIYLDFPWDEQDEKFQKFKAFFDEDAEGWSKKFGAVHWCGLSLKHAMKNAHHDEPGFWENWAENF